MLGQDLLHNSAERCPDNVALICDGHRLTYAQVEEQANRVANGLLALGVQRGDRVGVWLPNSVETVVAIFAILKAAGTFVVVNPTTRRDKLTYILDNCRATALFTSDRNASLAAAVHAAVPSLRFTVLCGRRAAAATVEGGLFHAFDTWQATYPATCPACPTIDQDLACPIYTSGSTGEPKKDILRHCRAHLEDFIVPRYVEFRDDLPKTGSGKIKKTGLR